MSSQADVASIKTANFSVSGKAGQSSKTPKFLFSPASHFSNTSTDNKAPLVKQAMFGSQSSDEILHKVVNDFY